MTISNMELLEYKKFCKLLADESGRIIKRYFRTNIKIENKSDNTPVTIADRSAEEKMRELIMREFPDHGIIGEEFENDNSDSDFQWVIDPIDGTKSFLAGTVTFGTLIGLNYQRKPLLGVINQPILDEFLIGDGELTELNGRAVNVRKCDTIENSVLLTTDHLNVHKYQNGDLFEKLIRRVKLYRQWGDCYGFYLVATGYADVMIDPIMSYWDKIALIPIIRGAGGVITDYQGNDPVKGESTIAAAPGIHKRIINALN